MAQAPARVDGSSELGKPFTDGESSQFDPIMNIELIHQAFGVLIDGGLGPPLLIGPIHISALVFELATGVLAFVAFSRARKVELSAA